MEKNCHDIAAHVPWRSNLNEREKGPSFAALKARIDRATPGLRFCRPPDKAESRTPVGISRCRSVTQAFKGRGKSGSGAEDGEKSPTGVNVPSAESEAALPGGVLQGGMANGPQSPRELAGFQRALSFGARVWGGGSPNGFKPSWGFQKPGAERSVWPGRCRRGKGRRADGTISGVE